MQNKLFAKQINRLFFIKHVNFFVDQFSLFSDIQSSFLTTWFSMKFDNLKFFTSKNLS